MATLVQSVSPWSAAVVLLAVLSVLGAIAAGRRRRRRWLREMQALDDSEPPPIAQLHRARRQLRASDSMSGWLRRVYYLITLLSAAVLAALPVLPLNSANQQLARIGLSSTTFLGALALLAYWRGSDDVGEGLLRARLRKAQEHAHARRGLAVRDELTGAYTLDFWLHVQELRTRRFMWRQTPVTCLMFDVDGLAEFRVRRGSAAADNLLQQIAQQIRLNLGGRDLIARYRGQRFVIALQHTPPKLGGRVANRISLNLDRLLLDATNRAHGSSLELRWSTASIPRDASSPIQLLRVTETMLDLERSPVRA